MPPIRRRSDFCVQISKVSSIEMTLPATFRAQCHDPDTFRLWCSVMVFNSHKPTTQDFFFNGFYWTVRLMKAECRFEETWIQFEEERGHPDQRKFYEWLTSGYMVVNNRNEMEKVYLTRRTTAYLSRHTCHRERSVSPGSLLRWNQPVKPMCIRLE